MFITARSIAASLRIAVITIGFGATAVTAQQFADNWNTGACGFTDMATLTIGQPVHLSRFELWYKWQPNEASVGYTVLFNGQVIGSGNLSRAGCDPYQGAWCVAQDTLSADLSPGTYTFRTERPRLCQNSGSGGAGFIRAYAD